MAKVLFNIGCPIIGCPVMGCAIIGCCADGAPLPRPPSRPSKPKPLDVVGAAAVALLPPNNADKSSLPAAADGVGWAGAGAGALVPKSKRFAPLELRKQNQYIFS
eukprot:TRINITY_DN11058_c0_g2_i2.p4 TRINITY_DN11058_c0_g2~~TRINITY_DN11058_c0_g2_i2.p4  ORF type:complete len:105 (-),score=14.44 TRINITY_DN11058_c0_g2_i2:1892-2206(-)